MAPLIVAALIWPLTYLVFRIFSGMLPPPQAYLAGFVFYWALLALLNLLFLGKSIALVIKRPSLETRADYLRAAACLALAISPFFVVFLSAAPQLTSGGWILLFLAACCNAPMEELFWRGVFIHRYPNDTMRGFLLPLLFFTLWHFTLVAFPGIDHGEGMEALLILGAAAFGLVWGYVAFRQRSIFFTILGHVLVNVFALSGLIQQNWPPT